MCKNCPTPTLCTLQWARQPYRTGTVSQINMGITGSSKPRAIFVMVFLCDRGGMGKASNRQSLAVLPKTYVKAICRGYSKMLTPSQRPSTFTELDKCSFSRRIIWQKLQENTKSTFTNLQSSLTGYETQWRQLRP